MSAQSQGIKTPALQCNVVKSLELGEHEENCLSWGQERLTGILKNLILPGLGVGGRKECYLEGASLTNRITR